MTSRLARTAALVVATLGILAAPAAAQAPAPTPPILVKGNVTCEALNDSTDAAFDGITLDWGFKIDGGPPPNGAHVIENSGGTPHTELMGGAPPQAPHAITISNQTDGKTFNWASTLPIDAVIVKGGNDSNAYVYTPESLGDDRASGLVSPLNSGGNVPTISHVTFCFDQDVTEKLDISKTVTPAFDRSWDWDIEKTADKTSTGPLTDGETFPVEYDVTVSAVKTDSYRVSGTITVSNPDGQGTATITSITDQLDDGTEIDVDCGPDTPDEGSPATLEGGATLNCTYDETGLDGDETENTATVTTSSGPAGGSETVPITWPADPASESDECITIEDDKYGGVLGHVCAGQLVGGKKTFSYEKDLAEVGECLDYTNTASFTTEQVQVPALVAWQTGQSSQTIKTDKVDLTINKSIPGAQAESQTFTFDIKDAGDNVLASPSVTFAPGQTQKSVTVKDLAPGVLTVSERAAAGWQSQGDKTIDLSKPTEECTGSVSFANAKTPPPPPNTPLQPNTPQGEQDVLGERVTPGSARLGGRTGCQGKAFYVRVKGKQIDRVTFRIDGKVKKVVRRADSQGRFKFRVDPRKFKRGSHKVTARAVFSAASQTRPKTMSLRFSRCVRAAQAPAFTG